MHHEMRSDRDWIGCREKDSVYRQLYRRARRRHVTGSRIWAIMIVSIALHQHVLRRIEPNNVHFGGHATKWPRNPTHAPLAVAGCRTSANDPPTTMEDVVKSLLTRPFCLRHRNIGSAGCQRAALQPPSPPLPSPCVAPSLQRWFAQLPALVCRLLYAAEATGPPVP